MSNFLAIATVTAALRQSLLEVLPVDVPGAEVTTTRPDGQSGGATGPGVNLFLYQVGANPALRNADLPTRTGRGELVHRPRAALDLHYLISFYGNDATLEPQRLLGSTVRLLHARPQLTRQMIQAAAGDASFAFLARSDLAEQLETVRLQPLSLSLEDLSRLWSTFFQTPYVLSVAYRAGVVMIEPDAAPRPPLPVRRFHLAAEPAALPRIEGAAAAKGPGQPILATDTLVIRGENLAGEITRVRIGDLETDPLEGTLNAREIRVALSSLPAGALRAGVRGVQVIHQTLLGTPPAPRSAMASHAAPLVLSPVILRQEAAAGQVAVWLDPLVGEGQQAALLLNELDPLSGRPARAFRLKALPHEGTVPAVMGFRRHEDDPVLEELGLDAARRVWGVLGGEVPGFAGLARVPARLRVTIAGRGPYELVLPGSLADLDAAAAALQGAIRAAHPSPAFAGAAVVPLGERLLVLPGTGRAAVVFEAFPEEPALEALGLAGVLPVAGYLTGPLSAFGGLTRSPARLVLTIGNAPPHTVTIAGSPGDAAAAGAALQAGIRAGLPHPVWTGARVVRVGERLFVMPGIRDLRFATGDVPPGSYLVRVQVDGAPSGLLTDADGRFSGPALTVP